MLQYKEIVLGGYDSPKVFGFLALGSTKNKFKLPHNSPLLSGKVLDNPNLPERNLQLGINMTDFCVKNWAEDLKRMLVQKIKKILNC